MLLYSKYQNKCRRAYVSEIPSYQPQHTISFIDSLWDIVTSTTDVSGCSVWICGTCDAKASLYLGSGRMTQVIRLELYTEVLGAWDSDYAGGRLLSTDTGLADLLPCTRRTKHLSSVDCFLVWLYIYMSIIHSDKWRQGTMSVSLLLENLMTAFNNQHSTI